MEPHLEAGLEEYIQIFQDNKLSRQFVLWKTVMNVMLPGRLQFLIAGIIFFTTFQMQVFLEIMQMTIGDIVVHSNYTSKFSYFIV